MSTILRRTLAFRSLAILAAFFSGVEFSQGANPDSRSYKLTLEAKTKSDFQGKPSETSAHTELHYSWKRDGQSRILTVDALILKVTQNGKSIQDSTMNRAKVRLQGTGDTIEYEFDKAPPALQAMLQDTFGAPLVIIQLDAQGHETSRKITAGPSAKSLLDNGLIANCLMLHPSFPTGQTQWQSVVEVSTGTSGFVKGPLTYQKIAGRADTYSVTGTLVNPELTQPGSKVVLKNARYVASGEETFDPATKEWAGGKVKFDVGFELFTNNKPLATSKGTMELTLETRK